MMAAAIPCSFSFLVSPPRLYRRLVSAFFEPSDKFGFIFSIAARSLSNSSFIRFAASGSEIDVSPGRARVP
jgi:hypothetical protein